MSASCTRCNGKLPWYCCTLCSLVREEQNAAAGFPRPASRESLMDTVAREVEPNAIGRRAQAVLEKARQFGGPC